MSRRLPAALLVYAQLGYPLLLAVWARLARRRAGDAASSAADATDPPPTVALVVAAHDEEGVIAEKVANALALDFPRDRLQVVVCCDGCSDGTAARARAAGADLVLDLPRGGKVRAQDAGVERTAAEVVVFSDANATLSPDALTELVAAFADPRVGLACGRVTFVNEAGTNQEGLYWRYEMAVRARESELASITAGNGALYAVRRAAYVVVDPVMGHDLSLPFTLVRRGWRAVERPTARATEKMVPSIEGEGRRKRRMMAHTWAIIARGGLLDLRGMPPGYALMLVSHRWLRYLGPLLHVLALGWRPARLPTGALLAAAALAAPVPRRPLLVARYYVLTEAGIALGLWDYARHGVAAGWDAAEGTR